MDYYHFLNQLLTIGLLQKEEFEALMCTVKENDVTLMVAIRDMLPDKKEEILNAFAIYMGMPYEYADHNFFQMVDNNLVSIFPMEFINQYQVIPLRVEGQILYIATSYQLPMELQYEMESYAKSPIQLVYVEANWIESALLEIQITQVKNHEKIANSMERKRYVIERQQAKQSFSIQSMVDGLICKALELRASDIHIEPSSTVTRVKYRIDGFLGNYYCFGKDVHEQIVNRIKILAGLDITERRQPQDGHVSMGVEQIEFDTRVSVMPLLFGEKIVIRILSENQYFKELSNISFSEHNQKLLHKFMHTPSGLLLVTGPTGSGKTTTIYAILHYLKNKGKNIITIEDPVEYEMEHINQVQINQKIDLDYQKILKYLLRQDPDIILIGEIRDLQTAKSAIQLANTGHLVIASLHSNHAFNAITRLIEIGIEDYFIAASLIGVISQRLVRKNCVFCQKILDQQVGCDKCNQTGYYGRIALHEVLDGDWIRNHLTTVHDERILAQKIPSSQFIPLEVDGMQKVQLGLTTLNEIDRVYHMEEW